MKKDIYGQELFFEYLDRPAFLKFLYERDKPYDGIL
jgi:hypothetical protein